MVQLLHLRHLPTCVQEALPLRYQAQGLGAGVVALVMEELQPAVALIKQQPQLMVYVAVPTVEHTLQLRV